MNKNHTFQLLSGIKRRYVLDEDAFLEQFGNRQAKEFYKTPIDGGMIWFDIVTAEQFTVYYSPEKTRTRITEFLERKESMKKHKPIRRLTD